MQRRDDLEKGSQVAGIRGWLRGSIQNELSAVKSVHEGPLDKLRIAILPFANISPDPNDEYFADGLTEELISTMSKIGGLKVIARTSVMAYKGEKKKIPEVARELEVGTILEGSVRKAGDRLRITVQLIDSSKGEDLWSESYDRRLEDIFAIQSEVSKTVVDSLRVKLLPDEKRRVEKDPTTSPKAYDCFLKGLVTSPWIVEGYLKDDIERSRQYFEKAVEIDPNFALAYAHLEGCYMEAFRYIPEHSKRAPKAAAAAQNALRSDPDLAESHLAYGDVLWHDYDLQGVEREFKRALELKPNSSLAHFFAAIYYSEMGRWSESESEYKLARELDPLSSQIRSWIEGFLYSSRQFDLALDYSTHMMKGKESAESHNHLARIFYAKGELEKAQKEIEKSLALEGSRPQTLSTLACLYAKSGREAEARKIARDLERDFSSKQYFSLGPKDDPTRTSLIPIYLALRDYDLVLPILEEMREEHSIPLQWLWTDPFFDGLHSDDRIVKFFRKLGVA
jgi:adenylate cyclase